MPDSDTISFRFHILGTKMSPSPSLRVGWDYVEETTASIKHTPYLPGHDCRDVNGMKPPAMYQYCCHTILEYLALATLLLHFDWHEMTEGILQDLVGNLDAINIPAETILSL